METVEPHRLLFVCTGNICRSPMAEGLARDYARRRAWAVEAWSGGVLGLMDRQASVNAVKVMDELGIDISGHRSGGVELDDMIRADYVLVMELAHATELRSRFPDLEQRVMLLGSFGGLVDIPDPIGGWRWRYRRARNQIKTCVESFMDQLPARPL